MNKILNCSVPLDVETLLRLKAAVKENETKMALTKAVEIAIAHGGK